MHNPVDYQLTRPNWLLHDEDMNVNRQQLKSQVETGWYLARLSTTIVALADQLDFTDPDAGDMLRGLANELIYVHEHYTLETRRTPLKRQHDA
jgi:hypothetical protein